MTLVLSLLIVQAAMGAVDTFLHHEFIAALPSRPGARRELFLHGLREAIYGVVFIGLSAFEWHGVLAWILAGLLLIEMAITLADFIEEDRTRRLPASERVLHTLMAIGFGVLLAALAPVIWAWGGQGTGVTWRPHGWLSAGILLAAAGVLLWSARDFLAARGVPPAPTSTAPREGTVLVTGATGFIGRALTAALLAQGRRVMILTRDGLAARAQFGPSPLIFENLEHVPNEMRIEAVVNLAGALVAGGRWTKRRRRILLQSRVHTTRSVVALMSRLERAPAVLVNASAVGFYGDTREAFLDEGAPPRSGFMSALVRRWEEEAFRAEGLGVRACFLRLGLVLDWSGGVLPILALPARFGMGAILGGGKQWAPWIHRDDVVRLILTAIDDPAWRGPINAVAPDLVTQGEFTARLARQLKAPQWLNVPAWPVRTALGEMADLLLAGQRVLPARLWDLGFRFSRPTLEAAFAKPTSPLRLPSPRRPRGPLPLAPSTPPVRQPGMTESGGGEKEAVGA